MEFTIYSVIYLITAVLSFLVSALAWKRKMVVGAKELSLLSFSVFVCACFLCLESASTTIVTKIIFSKFSYIGVVSTPVFYLLFVLRFTKLIRFRDIKAGWILLVFPLITLLLAITNEYHHNIWSTFSQISEETNIMKYYHGFWFWFGYVLYSYILLFISTYYLFRFILNNRNKKTFRHQGFLVVFAGLCPWIVSVFYLTGINPVDGLDITTISTTLSAILFTYSILKGSLLNLVPIARETLVETLPIGVIALDNQNRIQDINKVAKSILKIESDDALGKTPAQVASTSNELLEAIVSSDSTVQIDLSYESGFMSLQIIKQPLKALNGSRLITIYDITEQINRQNELIEAKLRAEESDNLKTAFLANMSHEIRTPMNSIVGFISIMQEENLTVDERREYLEIVKTNGDRLMKTLNDIVDISKIESGQIHINYSDFDINEILSDMYGLFKPEAELKGLEYNLSEIVQSDLSYVKTDKEKLYSIVINLIKNALKYTNSGFVKYDFSVSETHLYFSVTDSGIGIPADKMDAVFDRFVQINSTSKKTIEGSGLGLAISKAFVEMLGGKIWVESEEGKGSAFYITIPVEHPQSLF